MLRADRRDNSNVASGYYGHGWAGGAAYLSQLEGWYRTPAGAANERLYLARDLLDRALDAALAERRGAMSAAERTAAQQRVDRVQFYRRTFGLMYLIAEWYRPIHLAVERIRANNPSDALTPMQYPAHVDGTFVTFAKAHPDDPFPTDITRGTAAVEHTGIRGTGESGTVAAASDQILAQVLLRLDGTSQQWTVRGLRNQVHRYLASHDLTTANMPTLGSWLSRLPADVDHQLGMCSGSASVVTSADDARDPGVVVPTIPYGDRSSVGIYLPRLMTYLNWWLSCVYTTEGGVTAPRRAAGRDDRVAAGDNTESFGWVFSELKYMCAFVLLHGNVGLNALAFASAKNLILRG